MSCRVLSQVLGGGGGSSSVGVVVKTNDNGIHSFGFTCFEPSKKIDLCLWIHKLFPSLILFLCPRNTKGFVVSISRSKKLGCCVVMKKSKRSHEL